MFSFSWWYVRWSSSDFVCQFFFLLRALLFFLLPSTTARQNAGEATWPEPRLSSWGRAVRFGRTTSVCVCLSVCLTMWPRIPGVHGATKAPMKFPTEPSRCICFVNRRNLLIRGEIVWLICGRRVGRLSVAQPTSWGPREDKKRRGEVQALMTPPG